jgi:prepilin-type N-terminal cleavage/methylation domain-containing protein
MIRRALRKVHKGQGGFTLIEVLVVMTILGILAAIVSISLLGVTANARTKAKDAELKTVQAAFDAMLSDQQVDGTKTVAGTDVGPLADACDSSPHNNMTQWPGTGAHPGATYGGPDSTKVTVLATHYLREGTTQYEYMCNHFGDVTQGGVGPAPPGN